MNVLLLCPEDHTENLIELINQASRGIVIRLHSFTDEQEATAFLDKNTVDIVVTIYNSRDFIPTGILHAEAKLKGIKELDINFTVVSLCPREIRNLINLHLKNKSKVLR